MKSLLSAETLLRECLGLFARLLMGTCVMCEGVPFCVGPPHPPLTFTIVPKPPVGVSPASMWLW